MTRAKSDSVPAEAPSPSNDPAGSNLLGIASALSDLVVVTDAKGHILKIVWNVEGAPIDAATFQGEALEDTVTEECRPKIRQMLRAAAAGEPPRWREINHLLEGVGEIPVRYQALPDGERVIFVGRDMRAVATLQTRLVEAQRALDEDYGRLRQLQTRYRVLFQTSREPLLIAEGRTRRVQEANAAAAKLLGIEQGDLAGQTLGSLFAPSMQEDVRAALDRVISSGQPELISGAARDGGDAIDCRVTVFRAAEAMMLLCRPSRATARRTDEPAVEEMLVAMVDRIPDAVVLSDREGKMLWCNDAFLGMAETALSGQLRGEPLGRFLSRPGVDIDIIIQNATQHGTLRAFSSVVVGAYGSESAVEISVASLPDSQPPVIGFVMRDISRFDQMPARKNGAASESADHMMNLVGTVPLKELVRASTEEIEKMCIEAALKKTGNNRASAAEMLGLSRQSLYVKLRRFGLLNSRGDE